MKVLDTIQDYLKWRADISFLQEGLNEVDSLLFCAFTYFDLEKIIDYEEKVTIAKLYERFLEFETKDKKEEVELFKILSQSKRFQEVLVTLYFNEVSTEKEMQIAGMTFLLPNDTIFVAFKGTDGFVGWKEDFHLSYKKTIPSQIKAREYLDFVLQHTKKKVFVGGHSKGGNLALYASIYCHHFEQIERIFNFDGPGFLEEVVESTLYQMRKNKMVTYLPKASLVGNLFTKDMETILIKSKQFGLMEHDFYSWGVLNNHFIRASVLNEEAKNLSNKLDKLISSIPNQDKEKIITFVFDLLENVNKKGIKAILSNYEFNLEDLLQIKSIIPVVIEILKKL